MPDSCHVKPEQMFNLMWGYAEQYCEKKGADDVAAGTNNLSFSAVPAGRIRVIQHAAAYANQNNPALVMWVLQAGGVEHVLHAEEYPTALATVALPNPVVLAEGDYLQARFTGCVLNDDIRAAAVGHEMILEQ